MMQANLGCHRHVIAGAIVLLALVGGVLFWAVQIEISGAIVVQGQLAVERSSQSVQSEIGGRITGVFVAEGEHVRGGDVLFQLDRAAGQLREDAVNQNIAELTLRRARLQAEQDGTAQIDFPQVAVQVVPQEIARIKEGERRHLEAREAMFRDGQAQIATAKDQIAAQISGIWAQRAAVVLQIALIEEQLTAQEALRARGLTPAASVLALRREHARLTGQQGELRSAEAAANERITGLSLDALHQRETRREEIIAQLNTLSSDLSRLTGARDAILQELDKLVIRAPVSGIVHRLTVQHQGSVIRSGETLLHIVPQDRPMTVIARVTPKAVDQVHVGQTARLRLTGFNRPETPELNGQVVHVSPDAITGPNGGQSHYNITVQLPAGGLQDLGPDMPLLPGMPVEVFVIQAPRSAMSYLVKPLTDYFVRAWRES